jgi:hypothetical protein
MLILNYGVSPLDVYCQRGGHAAPRRAGGFSESFSGGLTSAIRAELMVVPVVLSKLSPANVATIRTLFANGAQVPCRGDVFNVAGVLTVTCSATITDEFHPAGPWFEGSLTLYEVSPTARALRALARGRATVSVS